MSEGTLLDVIYCEGWDPAARALLGRLSPGTARERDATGEQYAVALVLPGTEMPLVLFEIAWGHHFARTVHFDQQKRRQSSFEFRALGDDALFLVRVEQWTYKSDDQEEFDPKTAGHVELTFQPDGTGWVERSPHGESGGSSSTSVRKTVSELTTPRPAFGDWTAFTKSKQLTLRTPDVPDTDPPLPVEERPWRPSVPLQPSGLEEMFTPGTRFSLSDDLGLVEVEVRRAGKLRMPSGELVASDPAFLDRETEPFTVTVPPGDYPVEVALIRFVDEPDHLRVAAAKLVVTDVPVATWEAALRPGEDTLFLGDGHFHGYGVDSGTGCFADAAALPEKVDDDFIERFTEVKPHLDLTLDGVDGNIILFNAGWGDGSYPTWIGRAADGTLACFVTDMLVLNDAQVLTA
ncbi:DUF4241 domain-containing protein [Amycolatopsis regifaucium]|uniref:Cytosolic protein n=1 Tax=Amycolatopsis regifaucium TaxID=546365 RepID=A0A154MBI4_9PSEU|nr:DUF4241 domain-containing protein [Amycolatopsis regifaucium]KZB81988.1 cytosolic protein [Amycolatopsis regifaucium]OKA05938.1 cytosolic protein [Amycolatopsis regifaucium]SFG78821.1 Protein of unknown function [Amycolatopsis regifaucium]